MQNLLAFQQCKLKGFFEALNNQDNLLHYVYKSNCREVFGNKKGPQRRLLGAALHGMRRDALLAVVFLSTMLEKQD